MIQTLPSKARGASSHQICVLLASAKRGHIMLHTYRVFRKNCFFSSQSTPSTPRWPWDRLLKMCRESSDLGWPPITNHHAYFDSRVHVYAAFVNQSRVCLGWRTIQNKKHFSWCCWNIFYSLQTLTFYHRPLQNWPIRVTTCVPKHTCDTRAVHLWKRNFCVLETSVIIIGQVSEA